uniref:Uncharacterized protein n=1 Tax=Siphoviridae sp. cthae16 TaxID=2825617 RepID=A0A8S5URU9_9CAUD|nr:MAG TPA: hypothetical protein [Siphoviridae sp. cthae16]
MSFCEVHYYNILFSQCCQVVSIHFVKFVYFAYREVYNPLKEVILC